MQNFDYLVRKHNKALGLFSKVVAKLRHLEQTLNDVINNSNQAIKEANQKIEEEKQSLEFLTAQLTKTQESRAKVEQFIPDGVV